jgi:hypothetical protein
MLFQETIAIYSQYNRKHKKKIVFVDKTQSLSVKEGINVICIYIYVYKIHSLSVKESVN